MKVELINSLVYQNFAGIKWQIEQVANGHSDELWLATPHEDAVSLIKAHHIAPEKVFDVYRQQYLTEIDVSKGIWWSDLSVPNDAQIVVNQDWTSSVVSLGSELAQVKWFPQSTRIVQAVSWLDTDGKLDYKDIYHRDGTLFARQFFSEGDLLESDFYQTTGELSTVDYYFNGARNFVVHGQSQFSSADTYLLDVMSSFPEVTFDITQLGRELDFAPDNTQLIMPAGVIDDQGQIYPNLIQILTNDQHKIKRVIVSKDDYQRLIKAGYASNKLEKMS